MDKYIHGSNNETGSSTPTPLIPEELKVDKIVLSWIFTILSDTLQARLVVARPKSAEEAWGLISDIVKNNKWSRTNALKVELRSIKLEDQSMKSYFWKIKLIVSILMSLDSHVNDEDVIHYALEGLPDKYDQVCGFMHDKDTFPDLKMTHFMLITEEIRLKFKYLALPVDSSLSSLMVLMAQSGQIITPCLTILLPPKPYPWPIVQVSCITRGLLLIFSYGPYGSISDCKYVHDQNARPSTVNGSTQSRNTTNELLVKLLYKPGLNATLSNSGEYKPNNNTLSNNTVTSQTPPVAYSAQSPYGLMYYPVMGPVQQVQSSLTRSTVTTRQPTTLPHAFTTGTLHDPSTGAWNMDTTASSHLNNLIISLSIVLNSYFITRRVLLRCDSTGDLYPLTAPFPIPLAFLISQHTWNQRLGHLGSDVLRRLISNNVISCNKEKPPGLCHACQLDKHVRLPFVSSNTVVTSCFDIIYSDA
ncbi:ribonuclease H-like domain-containing protein [Tanacetum coccineum]